MEIDVRLDQVVLKALEKEPQLRYQRAVDVGKDITRITEHPAPAGGRRPALNRNAARGLLGGIGILAGSSAYIATDALRHAFLQVEMNRLDLAIGIAAGGAALLPGLFLILRGPWRILAAIGIGTALLGAAATVVGFLRSSSSPFPVTPAEVVIRSETAGRLQPLLPPPPPEPPGPDRTLTTESAVLAGLKWLARHQEENGAWSVTGHVRRCVVEQCLPNPGTDAFDVGVTGLSVLAFLGAGYSHLAKDEYSDPPNPGHVLKFGEVVRAGVDSLIARQDGSGLIGSTRFRRYLLNHVFASLALVEAYDLTAHEAFKDHAQRAVDAAFREQNRDGGWGDLPGISDAFCTGWVVVLAQTARSSKLNVDESALSRAARWLEARIDPEKEWVGYRNAGTSGAILAGADDPKGSWATLTALAVLAGSSSKDSLTRYGTRRWGSSEAMGLALSPPKFGEEGGKDFFSEYVKAAALFQFDGPEGYPWRTWNGSYKDFLVPSQKTAKDGCKNGSWDPMDRWSCAGGRIYVTATNVLGLEIYYRYANALFGSRPHRPQRAEAVGADDYSSGMEAYFAENYTVAFGLLSKVPKDHPNYATAMRIIGWNIYAVAWSKPEEGIPYLDRAYETAPKDPKVLEDVVRGYQKAGRTWKPK